MSNTKIPLDSFLKEEEANAVAFLATIEADESNKNNVVITPWNNDGCNCSNGLSVPKTSIDSVERTGQVHFCCGENHTVVKINFKKNATISLENALSQLAKAGSAAIPTGDTGGIID